MAEPQLRVDTHALRSVAVDVAATGGRIVTHFDGVRAELCPADQPGWAAAAALHAVVEAWGGHAEMLRGRAVDAGARLTRAADGYDGTDHGVACRFGPG
ncbi:hypothetical protein Lfu02_32220 [Longispora fulva]|uniref:Uncharacterized protein YukE n=1 Tax=Longispora fulva TaxID=619741 RepID=A0A8J7GEV9_9ACTN|nr:type VII secretion target [Longispora fulva]MBG6139353.1 uncharacterized protein YukE [Longispora fulva]GIG58850.1 hypothetical protein Lfu02_32220 [Longispora fulva]